MLGRHICLTHSWDFVIHKGRVIGITPLFRERLLEKMCTRQSRKVIRDMINNLFLTLQLLRLRLLLSFSTRKHTPMASLSKPPTIPYGVVACTFSDNLSGNSCIQNELATRGTGSLTQDATSRGKDTPGNTWVYEILTETHTLLQTKMCDFPRSYFLADK